MSVVPLPPDGDQVHSSLLASWFRGRPWFLVLSVAALTYAFLAGLRTVSDFDLFWQMATGRWVAQHHAIFSTDVFSYTAQGKPWIYPAGSGLIFYATFLLGGYGLISWLGALACVGTIGLLLRRASAVTAALAVIAVPAIAARTSPRADMFTVVLFAAFLSVLWERHENGTGKLWLLPLVMVAWVNLHLGFISGLGIACIYAVSEAIRMFGGQPRQGARVRLKFLLLWLIAMFLGTLVNPWGWGIFRAILQQEAAMSVHSERITEWARITLTPTSLQQALALRDPGSSAEWLLLAAAVAAIVAIFRRQWLAAVLLSGSLWLAMQHVRFMVVLACVVVVVGGAVLTTELDNARRRFPDKRLCAILAGGVAATLILLAGIRSVDLVSNRNYLAGDEITSFGAGLSWWFPDRAMAFIERENLPAQVFSSYEDGGFLLWRLGPRYSDYVDGRAIPFGPNLFNRLQQVMQSPPDSPDWQQTADFYGINTIVFSLARLSGLKYVGSVLPLYCKSEIWRPVYLDEVSAVFVRRMPETQSLIDHYPVDCSTAPIPLGPYSSDKGTEFNRWANAAALLLILNRNQESADASTQALSVFGGSPALWYFRGRAMLLTGHPSEAERDLLQSASLGARVVTWSALADLYGSQRRYPAAINALEHLAAISPDPAGILIALGYTNLDAGKPKDAIQAFDRAEKASRAGTDNPVLADADNGRALAWSISGDLGKATLFEEKAVVLAPQVPGYWTQLARLYDLQGRATEARGAREKALVLTGSREP